MEHPIFSLSTKPDHRIRRYEHGDIYVEIKPSADGLATIHDRDVLIYCISQMVSALNDGREVSQTVRLKAYDLLTATNRMTNGQGYQALKGALERLGGTRISTNITSGGHEVFENFGLIERSRIVRETREGRMQEVEIKLSDWVFNAIRSREVLTLHRDYFRLRKPLERRMYEIARKHCGRQGAWSIRLNSLKKKCGSNSTTREFRRLVSTIVKQDQSHNHFPDYSVFLDPDDMVIFTNRRTIRPALSAPTAKGFDTPLNPESYHDARIVAPGWDVHYLEQQWRSWVAHSMEEAGMEPPRSLDRAFIGFCRKWFENKGPPA